MSKYNTPNSFVPGFAKQKSIVGAYVSDDNSRTNPLADSQLMAKQSSSYGGYEKYSIGWTVPAKQKRPGIQNRGNVQNGQ